MMLDTYVQSARLQQTRLQNQQTMKEFLLQWQGGGMICDKMSIGRIQRALN